MEAKYILLLRKNFPDSLETQLLDQTKEDSSEQNYHIVLAGDTLYKIANHYGFSVAEVAAWNGLQEPYNLSIGQKLWLTPNNQNLRPAVGVSGYHIVKTGESLASIAKKYGISLSDLADWNGIGSPYTVYTGLRLTLIPD